MRKKEVFEKLETGRGHLKYERDIAQKSGGTKTGAINYVLFRANWNRASCLGRFRYRQDPMIYSKPVSL